jgi:hypothetical protein
MVPRDVIAARLYRLFQPARIVFTIRNQEKYISSMYLNLKRNSAFFSRMPMPPVSQWYQGMLTQFRCHYLQNLNFYEVIDVYRQLFGRENILILPLEMLINDGPSEYLGTLCKFADIALSRADVERYREPRNTRMSAMKGLAADMIADDQFFDFYSVLRQRLGREQLDELLDSGDRAAAMLEPEDLTDLGQRVAAGNRLLAGEYGVELERYGYPLGEEGAFSAAPVRAALPRPSTRSESSTDRVAQLQALIDSQIIEHSRLVDELNERFAAEREALVGRIRQLELTQSGLPKLHDRSRRWLALARSFGMTSRASD